MLTVNVELVPRLNAQYLQYEKSIDSKLNVVRPLAQTDGIVHIKKEAPMIAKWQQKQQQKTNQVKMFYLLCGL